jgi:hypothetical protein
MKNRFLNALLSDLTENDSSQRICVEPVKLFLVFVALISFIPDWASGDGPLQSIAAESMGGCASASGASTLNLLSGSHATLLSPQLSDFDAYRCRVGWTGADEQVECPPWQWARRFGYSEHSDLGVDLQALSVLNQSPGRQNPYFSCDVSVNVLLREWNLYELESCNKQAVITLMHEPALGIIRSMHFRDPGDTTGTPAQTPNLTIHPLLDAQSDLFNLTINHIKNVDDPLVEFKLTVAPQLDLYGRFTGKDAQVQLPLQPNIELHFTKQGSLVLQVSIPLFTRGGRNPPASFAIGLLWHALNKISEAGATKEAGAADR